MPDGYTDPTPAKLASLANLKPAWPEGYCPNPKGRPKGSKNRSTLYREWLEMGSHEADVMKALIAKAVDGDIPAIKEIFDGAYGKLTDKQELTGKDGEPVKLDVAHLPPDEAYKKLL